MHKQKDDRENQKQDQQGKDQQDHRRMRIPSGCGFLRGNGGRRNGRGDRRGMILGTILLHIARSGQIGGEKKLAAKGNGDVSEDVTFGDGSGNGFFRKGYTGVEFCHEALKYLSIRIEVEGSIPEGGPYTFVSNHPLGGIDGLALLDLIGSNGKEVRLLGNDFLAAIKGLAPMIVPISKVGMQSRSLKSNIDQAFRSDVNMLVCPAGKVSRKTGGVIQDRKWAKTFLQKSI